MFFTFNTNCTPNSILEILKIIIPGVIGLIPFFYNVLTDKKRKEKELKYNILNKLYDNLQNYYFCSLNYSLSSYENNQNEKIIRDSIYQSRINFMQILSRSQKYLEKNDIQNINKVKELLLDLDQNNLSMLNKKELLYKDYPYDKLQHAYNLAIDTLNKYI